MSTPSVRTLVNLKDVGKGYGSRTVLRDVTLGIAAGDRIGIVGRNGDGKSTLLKLIGGREEPDDGLVTRVGTLQLAAIDQGDELDGFSTVRQALVGDRPDHEWLGDPRFRSVLDGLLGGVDLARLRDGIDTAVAGLSGGERRRISLARLLLDPAELLLLDEPTNHLDVEGVDWLARHLSSRRGAMIVVTHDRWFLDAVCTHTWEVSDGSVFQYEGGYAAYVLARAERGRQASSREDRRQQLMRKELAWLRRGPPARTAKPKFRIEAANALIADEPDPRDTVELLRFASARLGDRVLDAEGVSVKLGTRQVLDDLTWRLAPGQRLGLVGVNGAGKTTLLDLLAGERTPDSGQVARGATVALAHLTQDAAEIPGHLRAIEALEEVRQVSTTSAGQQVTAGKLAERFGFAGPKGRTLVRDLSGGERRRLQLMRLLMEEPNVLLLDEPTNDLDTDTLTALEDLLDSWPGTLVVVSHDRYFVERVCDDVYGLMGDGAIRHLPGGIEQYLTLRGVGEGQTPGDGVPTTSRAARGGPAPGGRARTLRKELAKLERTIEKAQAVEARLHASMAAAATDQAKLARLDEELRATVGKREDAEAAWLGASEELEGS